MRAEPAELATVLTLNQANLDGVGPLDDDRLRWLLEMASADGQALVADDGEIAGFAMVFEPDTDYDSSNYRWFVERFDAFGYLDRIVVAPTHRRRGMGTLLYDAAEDGARAPAGWSARSTSSRPTWRRWRSTNDRGYVEVGRVLQANGKTCVMLEKDLR